MKLKSVVLGCKLNENPRTEVAIKTYLRRIKNAEKKRPASERRHVPSHGEFAEILGMTPTAFGRFASDQVGRIDKEHLALIIYTLRESGFDTTYDDLMVYYPPDPKE